MLGCGGGGGGGGAAATVALPLPPDPIIITIIIIIIGSIPWFLFPARSLMELVIWVSIVVSWSDEPLDRDDTREAPPNTRARSGEAIEHNRFALEGMFIPLW
jgi:hypothetical protein